MLRSPSLLLVSLSSLVLLPLPGLAQSETTPPARSTPLFTRHIVPLFGKLGCNAGACHGMVQGKGGFRLSLFGVDPLLDHERLLREALGRRIDRVHPNASLILLKAAGQVPHEGGQRTQLGSPEYRLLRTWIAAGAHLDAAEKSIVQRLEVLPSTRTAKPGDQFAFQVNAFYADNSKEDVTDLCVFEVGNREVAEVDARGKVRAIAVGDAALVVRYRSEVAMGNLIVMPEKPAASLPSVKEHNFIDKHILARLRLLNIQPAELCDDATFLRRASLDVTGALPTTEEIRNFLADKDVNKRAKKIDEILKRPGHSALWATRFMDTMRITGFMPASFPPAIQEEYRGYEWLRARLRENIPYDELVERILTATTREGHSLEEWADQAIAIVKEEIDGKLPATYTSRRTLDLFWQRRMATDVDHAIRVGHSFLGLRLQCAQCHRHPHDVWTQDDLLSFANFFMRIPHFADLGGPRAMPAAEVIAFQKKKAKEVPAKGQTSFNRVFGGREIWVLTSKDLSGPDTKGGRSFFSGAGKGSGFATVSSPLGTQSSRQLRFLGEKEAIAAPSDGVDRRALVMAWLRKPDNPFFARAIVNRIWAHYFDRGIINPPDDLSPLNPPSHPELLQELSAGLIKNKYDLHWLHRVILNSRTYQQSSLTNASNRHDRRNFASFYLRRLPAEVLLDALEQSAGVPPGSTRDRVSGSMPAGLRMLEGGAIFHRGDTPTSFTLATFGRPDRDVEVVCDCERENQATMLQALYLANHPHLRQKVLDPRGALPRIIKTFTTDTERITEVFLSTLARTPTESELKLTQEYLKGAGSPQKGLEGLMWSLLNSNEFQFNR